MDIDASDRLPAKPLKQSSLNDSLDNVLISISCSGEELRAAEKCVIKFTGKCTSAINVLASNIIRVTLLRFSSCVTQQSFYSGKENSRNNFVAEYWFMVFHSYSIQSNCSLKVTSLATARRAIEQFIKPSLDL